MVQPSLKPSQGVLNLHHRFPLVYNRKGVGSVSIYRVGEHYSPHTYTTTPRVWCHRVGRSGSGGGGSWSHVADVRTARKVWLAVGRVLRLVRRTLCLPPAQLFVRVTDSFCQKYLVLDSN